MKEALQSRGFKFESSCNCRGETSWTYSFPDNRNRIEVTKSQVFIKSPNPIHFSVIDFGYQNRFDEFLTKYFGL